MACCSQAVHERMKATDPLRVASGPYQGHQEDGTTHGLALYGCPDCDSTLAMDPRVLLMWAAVREAGNYAAEGNVEACWREIERAGQWAHELAQSLEWHAQEERARVRRLELERGGVVLAVVP